jgi:hypothetical protein
MRAQSLQRQRDNRVRREAVDALYEAEPWCARCGRGGVSLAGHERLGRAQGGDPTRPDCLLCDHCNTVCEDRPVFAAWFGWKTSDKHPRAPWLGEGEAVQIGGGIYTFGGAA